MSKKKNRGKRPSVKPALDWFDTLPGRRKHIVCGAVLILVSLILFGPIHFSSKSLIGSDTVAWRAMAEAMLQYEEATGEEALWAPNMFGGMPGYMIAVDSSVFQIDTVAVWLRRVIWPSSHFLILLFGTYWLCFFLTRNNLASVFGACAYGLSNYIPLILTAGHNSKFIALCFAPLLVLAFLYVLKKPGLMSAALFAIAAAANLRAGHIQITYYFTIIIGIWWLSEGIRALRAGESGPFIKSTAFLILGSLAALALVAQPYLANFEYKEFTIRGTGGQDGAGLSWEYAMGWSQGRVELLTLLISNAAGGNVNYWGPKIATAGPHYFGVLSILMSLIAIARSRSVPVIALAVSIVVTIAFSLGENLESFNRFMFDWLPMYQSLRVPETWLAATAFCAAVLGSIGVAALMGEKEKEDLLSRRTLIPIGALAALLIVLIVGKDSLLGFEKPNETAIVAQQVAQSNNVPTSDPRVQAAAEQYVGELKEARRDLFSNDSIRTLVVLILATLLLWLLARSKIAPSVFAGVLIVIMLLDLGSVTRRYLNSSILVEASDVEEQVPKYNFDQFIIDRTAERGGPGHFRALSLESNPFANARPAFHYETVGGYHAAKLGIYQEYLDNVLFRPGTLMPSGLGLDLMNVRYVIAARDLPGLIKQYQDSETGLAVYEKIDVLPRAYFVSEFVVEPEASEARELLKGTDIRSVVVLNKDPGIPVATIDSSSTARAEIISHTAREIRLQVETDQQRLLVLSEVFYPAGWTATIGEDDTEILKANALTRAVVVPAGQHEVVFQFNPRRHFLGKRIALIATILIYGFVLLVGAHRYSARRRLAEPATFE